jgi:hypothetical protein
MRLFVWPALLDPPDPRHLGHDEMVSDGAVPLTTRKKLAASALVRLGNLYSRSPMQGQEKPTRKVGLRAVTKL